MSEGKGKALVQSVNEDVKGSLHCFYINLDRCLNGKLVIALNFNQRKSKLFIDLLSTRD